MPSNQAMSEYRGSRGEDMLLNHLVNRIVVDDQLRDRDRLNSLVTGLTIVVIHELMSSSSRKSSALDHQEISLALLQSCPSS